MRMTSMEYKEVEALSEDELYNYDFSRHGILFRERLVELRKEKGYTQQALVDLLGISVWTLNSYEAKGVLPRFDMIIMLCKALGCTADYLLGKIVYVRPAADFQHLSVVNVIQREMDTVSK